MHVITWCNLPWTNPVGTQLLPWPSTNQERCRHCFPNISPGAWDPNGPAMALWWDLEPAIFTVPHLYTELKWKHQKHLNELISLPFFARISRYVRILCQTRATPWGCSILELQVFPAFAGLFHPVDGGTSRACRGSSRSDNSPSHYTVLQQNTLKGEDRWVDVFQNSGSANRVKCKGLHLTCDQCDHLKGRSGRCGCRQVARKSVRWPPVAWEWNTAGGDAKFGRVLEELNLLWCCRGSPASISCDLVTSWRSLFSIVDLGVITVTTCENYERWMVW